MYHTLYNVLYIVKVYIICRAEYSVTMTKKGFGRVVAVGDARTRYITVPAAVAGDSLFPFSDNEQVLITIDENRKCLRIEKHSEK